MVSGTVVVGNHGEADVVLPENRADPGQTFRPSDYLELYVRGRAVSSTFRKTPASPLQVPSFRRGTGSMTHC